MPPGGKMNLLLQRKGHYNLLKKFIITSRYYSSYKSLTYVKLCMFVFVQNLCLHSICTNETSHECHFDSSETADRSTQTTVTQVEAVYKMVKHPELSSCGKLIRQHWCGLIDCGSFTYRREKERNPLFVWGHYLKLQHKGLPWIITANSGSYTLYFLKGQTSEDGFWFCTKKGCPYKCYNYIIPFWTSSTFECFWP